MSHSEANQVSKRNARNSRHELSVPQSKLLEALNPQDAPQIAQSLKCIFEVSAFSTGDECVTPQMRDCLFDLYRLIPLIEAVSEGGAS